ncbi:MAG: zinc ribbon domain-containing protein [Mycobacterium sp.]
MTAAHCQSCDSDVPAGTFCGSCGAELAAPPRRGPARLRLRTYAAEPREHVLRPWVASSLFPHLPHRSRLPFRVCLAALLALLVTFGLLRWQAPMVAVAAVGLPLLFVTYLVGSQVRRNISPLTFVVSGVIGIALGIGWAWAAVTFFADGYDLALTLGADDSGPSVWIGVAVSVAEVLLMLVPAAAIRLVSRATHTSLDGFLIGALGGTLFTAASTVTFLAPQLAAGPVADDRSLGGLMVEAGLQGVSMPVISVAAGGMFGAALWFRPNRDGAHLRRDLVAAAVVVLVGLFAGLGLLDVAALPGSLYVGGYLLVAALTLIAARIVLQFVLLHETDGPQPAGQLPCPACGQDHPPTAFCPNCGAATGAASGLATHRVAHSRVLGTMAVAVAVATAVAVVVSIRITPDVATYQCPPDCGTPPLGEPVQASPRFSADDGAFSVAYPREGGAYKASFNPNGLNGVVLDYVAGDTGTLYLFGEPARDRAAKDIAVDLIKEKYPDATVDYEIPNASVGYQPGYGFAVDEYPQNSIGGFSRLRVLMMVAVKHDYALVAAAVGPYHEFSPDYGSGHPSAANLELAMDMGKYVNSFRWGGDRHSRLQ